MSRSRRARSLTDGTDPARRLALGRTRGIRLYISQILEAEATLARGDQIVEEMSREARECRKVGEQARKDCDGEPDGRLTVRRPLSMRPVGSVNLPQHADQHHPNDRSFSQSISNSALSCSARPYDPSTFIHAGQCEHIHTSDPALLRAILKVRTGWAGLLVGGMWHLRRRLAGSALRREHRLTTHASPISKCRTT